MCCHDKRPKAHYVKKMRLRIVNSKTSVNENQKRPWRIVNGRTYQRMSHWHSAPSTKTPHRLESLSALMQELLKEEAGGGGGEGGGKGGKGGGDGGDGGNGGGGSIGSSAAKLTSPTQNPALSQTVCDFHICIRAPNFQTTATRPSSTWIVVGAWNHKD